MLNSTTSNAPQTIPENRKGINPTKPILQDQHYSESKLIIATKRKGYTISPRKQL